MKKLAWGMATMIFLFSIFMAGCGQEEKLEPREAFSKALQSTAEVDSYSFKGTLKMNAELPPSEYENDPYAEMILQYLRDTEIVMSGVYQKDPMQTELTLDLNMGDMKFSIPMVSTETKLFVKVPNIPMITAFLPQDLVGKYIEMDMEELSEISGEEFNPESIDLQTQQEAGIEILDAFINSFDGETYFSSFEADEAELPSGVEADEVAQFQVNNDNLEDALNTLVNTALPAVIDVLQNEEYAKALNIDTDELDQMKEELTSNEQDVKEAISEIKEKVSIHDFSITTAIDEDYYLPYMELNVDVDITDQGETGSFGMNYMLEMNNFNAEQEFEIGIPSGDDVVNLTELEEMFYSSMEY